MLVRALRTHEGFQPFRQNFFGNSHPFPGFPAEKSFAFVIELVKKVNESALGNADREQTAGISSCIKSRNFSLLKLVVGNNPNS